MVQASVMPDEEEALPRNDRLDARGREVRLPGGAQRRGVQSRVDGGDQDDAQCLGRDSQVFRNQNSSQWPIYSGIFRNIPDFIPGYPGPEYATVPGLGRLRFTHR